MTVASVASRALAGVDAPEVAVEVHLGPGLPAFHIVGLPDAQVREARDRVRAALNHARFEFPARRITVNLAPAELPKDSSRFDLPIALGILASSGQLVPEALQGLEFAGELSLTGELRPVRGALAMALSAREAGRAFVLPEGNAPQAALAEGARILPARTLLDVVSHLAGEMQLAEYAGHAEPARPGYADFSDVKGQQQVKRALEVAAAGGHSVLMVGPPGTGKSMLAARFPGILPPLSQAEALEVAAVHSVSSAGFDASRWGERPFRAPHHSASGAALVGGGVLPRPGEISLAHHGVLFLDELPEFDRDVLEALREPLESGRVAISRAARQVQFPARFQLVAAMNPCPCGHCGDRSGRCRCTPERIARYRGRISGPFADRIDIKLEVPAPREAELVAPVAGEPSASIAARVAAARERQMARQGKPNALLGTKEIDRLCATDRDGDQLLRQALARLLLSARAYHRVLRVARSIADLAQAAAITAEHIAEAIQYRRLDASF
ncbi:MAG TPA: YifB family Mg chelatase-like AAA ATPase [Burkholderiales bacterium]|jgi:magnesium chelatase family protein|nr:YifB family Mg chelatase-like AAA ATPase [Burkholderiales bacterium]